MLHHDRQIILQPAAHCKACTLLFTGGLPKFFILPDNFIDSGYELSGYKIPGR